MADEPYATFAHQHFMSRAQTIRGFFVQDALTTSTDIGPVSISKNIWCILLRPFGQTPDHFGLVSKSWTEFVDAVNELSAKRPDSVSYKVLFLGRHGEGTRG